MLLLEFSPTASGIPSESRFDLSWIVGENSNNNKLLEGNVRQ